MTIKDNAFISAYFDATIEEIAHHAPMFVSGDTLADVINENMPFTPSAGNLWNAPGVVAK